MPRSRAQRKADTLASLRTEVDCWVASADELGNAHLVPLSHYWDGAALVLATPRSSPTATNLLRAGVARVGVGPTRDVVLVDGRVTEGVDDATADEHTEHTGFDARTEPGDYVYLRVTPTEIRAWSEANELSGRLLIRTGVVTARCVSRRRSPRRRRRSAPRPSPCRHAILQAAARAEARDELADQLREAADVALENLWTPEGLRSAMKRIRDHRRVQARSHRSPVDDQRSRSAQSANGRPVSSSVLAFLGTSLAILAAEMIAGRQPLRPTPNSHGI